MSARPHEDRESRPARGGVGQRGAATRPLDGAAAAVARPILHTIDTGGPGGAETIYTQVATGLAPGRWRSIAVVPEPGWLLDTLRAAGADTRLLRSTRSFDVRYVAALVALIRRSAARLVHAHLFDAGVYASLAARIARVPVVCTLHGRVDVSHDDPYLAAKRRILDRRRNRIVFVSESLRRWYAGAAPLRRAPTRVVHNGIDLDAFAPGRDPTLRRELGLADDELLVGAVGNIRPAKDYATLLRAAALLREQGARVHWVVVGEGDCVLERQLLEERAALGLEATVTFAGFRADVPAVLRGLDVYVSSSSSEGFSLTTVQAMASGLPVLATRCGGPEEIVDDGATGVLVPPSSPRALADALARLLADPRLRASLGRSGRAAASARFALERMVAGYEAVYADALGLGGVETAVPDAAAGSGAGNGLGARAPRPAAASPRGEVEPWPAS